ncbi:c-type cytochrome [Plastoroseomonas arctica]|uniref:Cytochrome C n=1 Tax=Plastoroseomonas arctica TaxID=1509237 RepID=A0AAF1KNJ0_9PROT|nr:c-type cytochrome [Plastoroseomonas arctica]MBR0654658.1 cytochrome C [Plastoroseomonas arctica]
MRWRLLALLAWPAMAMAQEAPPGASTCLGCHASTRTDAAIPSLRGRDPADVAEAMRAFREGRRPATLMDRLAKGFSEEESQAIAAWIVR